MDYRTNQYPEDLGISNYISCDDDDYEYDDDEVGQMLQVTGQKAPWPPFPPSNHLMLKSFSFSASLVPCLQQVNQLIKNNQN